MNGPNMDPKYRECPGVFCFLFVEIGDITSAGRATIAHCHLQETDSRPLCDRDTPPGRVDHYEPCEPALRRADLSEDHFVRPV